MYWSRAQRLAQDELCACSVVKRGCGRRSGPEAYFSRGGPPGFLSTSLVMLNCGRTLRIAAVCLGLPVCSVSAQTDSRLAVGASVTTRVTTSSEAGGGAAVGFEWRLGHGTPGWGWQTSLFSWFDTDVQGPVATDTFALGHVRIRPIMAGYGYTWVRGRPAITAGLVGGYTLNSFRLDSDALAEYAQRLGASGIDSEATNAFAVKPEVQVWYDLNRRLGLKLNGGYLIAHPSLVIRSSLGEDVQSDSRRYVPDHSWNRIFALLTSAHHAPSLAFCAHRPRRDRRGRGGGPYRH